MKSVLVLGYFGYSTNQIDGQTIKTRQVFKLLNKLKESKYDLLYFDTQSFQDNKLFFFRLLKLLLKTDLVFYLPGKSNLTFIFPIVYVLSKIFKFKIVYPVVGGWLPEYLNKKKFYVFLLKRIEGVLVESELMVKELQSKFQFNNVELLYNFRDHNFVPSFNTNHKKFKIVFMARVMKEKGIYKVLEFVKYMQSVEANFSFIVDFYGPINKNDKSEFLNAISEFKNVCYKGVIDPDNVFNTLNKYDLLLLPTFYDGEGFPGTIVDAYISGIPVIVSNWKLLPSFVLEGETGYVFYDEIENDLCNKILKLFNNPKLLEQMKLNSFQYSKQFSAENSKDILLKFI